MLLPNSGDGLASPLLRSLHSTMNPLTNQPWIRTLVAEAELTTVFFNPPCTSPARPLCLAGGRRVATGLYRSMSESWMLRHSGGALDMEGEAP